MQLSLHDPSQADEKGIIMPMITLGTISRDTRGTLFGSPFDGAPQSINPTTGQLEDLYDPN